MADGIPHPAKGGQFASIVYNDFLMPGSEHVYEPFVIAGGQQLLRGSVLGAITASGKLILSLNAAADGSQNAMAILCEDLDTTVASGADIPFHVLVHGRVNPEALVFGAGQTEANTKAAMRAAGIYYVHPF
jgi:hypothetical protein